MISFLFSASPPSSLWAHCIISREGEAPILYLPFECAQMKETPSICRVSSKTPYAQPATYILDQAPILTSSSFYIPPFLCQNTEKITTLFPCSRHFGSAYLKILPEPTMCCSASKILLHNITWLSSFFRLLVLCILCLFTKAQNGQYTSQCSLALEFWTQNLTDSRDVLLLYQHTKTQRGHHGHRPSKFRSLLLTISSPKSESALSGMYHCWKPSLHAQKIRAEAWDVLLSLLKKSWSFFPMIALALRLPGLRVLHPYTKVLIEFPIVCPLLPFPF
jgi:hypothetical protein